MTTTRNRMNKEDFQARREELVAMARSRISRLKKSDGSPALHNPSFESDTIQLLDVLFYLVVEYPQQERQTNEKE